MCVFLSQANCAGMSSGLRVLCSNRTFHPHHSVVTGESTQITAWCLNRESVYTSVHTHMLVSVYHIEWVHMPMAFTLRPHVDSSLSVLVVLIASRCRPPGLNAGVFCVLSKAVLELKPKLCGNIIMTSDKSCFFGREEELSDSWRSDTEWTSFLKKSLFLLQWLKKFT